MDSSYHGNAPSTTYPKSSAMPSVPPLDYPDLRVRLDHPDSWRQSARTSPIRCSHGLNGRPNRAHAHHLDGRSEALRIFPPPAGEACDRQIQVSKLPSLNGGPNRRAATGPQCPMPPKLL